jgi:hypothetical protein
MHACYIWHACMVHMTSTSHEPRCPPIMPKSVAKRRKILKCRLFKSYPDRTPQGLVDNVGIRLSKVRVHYIYKRFYTRFDLDNLDFDKFNSTKNVAPIHTCIKCGQAEPRKWATQNVQLEVDFYFSLYFTFKYIWVNEWFSHSDSELHIDIFLKFRS